MRQGNVVIHVVVGPHPWGPVPGDRQKQTERQTDRQTDRDRRSKRRRGGGRRKREKRTRNQKESHISQPMLIHAIHPCHAPLLGLHATHAEQGKKKRPFCLFLSFLVFSCLFFSTCASPFIHYFTLSHSFFSSSSSLSSHSPSPSLILGSPSHPLPPPSPWPLLPSRARLRRMPPCAICRTSDPSPRSTLQSTPWTMAPKLPLSSATTKVRVLCSSLLLLPLPPVVSVFATTQRGQRVCRCP